ncbi:MAG: DUF4298 domain-containing protein [Campylobacter sp.]|nr:DUF4298 domain-containing protein [Campylobacter sp.]
MTQIQRIEKMSEILGEVIKSQKEFEIALENFKNSQKLMAKLSRYYFGGAWRKDYECDEQGKIPKTINRGALSEDGIYNAIWLNKELAKDIQKIAKKVLNTK